MNIEVIKLALNSAIEDYWQAAYQQGKDGRDHDDKSGSAQDAESRIDAAVSAMLANGESGWRRSEKLAAALEPFAAIPDSVSRGGRFFAQLLICPEGDEQEKTVPDYGPAIRKARAALHPHQEGEKESSAPAPSSQMEGVVERLRALFDETPLSHVPYPVGPFDTPSWGRGLNSGWDAGIKEAIKLIEAATSEGQP